MNDLKSYESSDKSLLVLDDDDIFRNRLITAMERKGFKPFGAASVAEAETLLKKNVPKYAVIDLRLNDGNGLQIVSMISSNRSDSKIVMLTGYGNIPTAVAIIAAIIFGLFSIWNKPVLSIKIAGNIIAGKIADGTKDKISLILSLNISFFIKAIIENLVR